MNMISWHVLSVPQMRYFFKEPLNLLRVIAIHGKSTSETQKTFLKTFLSTSTASASTSLLPVHLTPQSAMETFYTQSRGAFQIVFTLHFKCVDTKSGSLLAE